MLRGKGETCDKHHIHHLVKSSITAIRNVKTAELAPVNGCDGGPEPSYRLLDGRALGKDPQKQEVTLPKLVLSETSCRLSKAARLAPGTRCRAGHPRPQELQGLLGRAPRQAENVALSQSHESVGALKRRRRCCRLYSDDVFNLQPAELFPGGEFVSPHCPIKLQMPSRYMGGRGGAYR